MRKNSWKMRCVDNNNLNRIFTVGKIYEVKNGMVQRDCDSFTIGVYIDFNEWCKICKSTKWELVENSFTKSDLQELDIVILGDENRYVYFDKQFFSRNGCKFLKNYNEDLTREDSFEKIADVMQIYRNGQLIFNREEQSPRDIKIKELQDKMDAIKREMEELK